ncbi:MAG: threonine--tRNA ligase [Rhodothermales bacterium]|nr:threonine--tRNA ligase [Rhodothermales bacterium]
MANEEIHITFPDGTVKPFQSGITGAEIASSISSGLARMALAVDVDGDVWDLSRPLTSDASVSILTWRDDAGKNVFWHSTAHVMAEALQSLYPDVKFGIGPPIETGFYYDVDLGDEKIGTEQLEAIEARMKELIKANSTFERKEVSKADATDYFNEKGDEYKLELIDELEDGTITFYTQGDFTDLCRGPHVPSTGVLKYPKLLTVAGAYWRGDEKRPQLTRIYGVSFPKKAELEEYLERVRLAKERDHRKLGKELELFTFSQKVGPGLPLWLPKGTVVRDTLESFLKQEQLKRGYQPVITPHIGRLELYKISGHYPYYSDSQFPPMMEDDDEDQGYLLKPMNCPHHIQIYDDKPRSYRELPVRLAEFGNVYRYEQSGELGGLTRVRGFTVDDAHIFCRPDQVKAEFKDAIELTLKVLKALDFEDYRLQVSVRDRNDPDKYVGDPATWDEAEQSIRDSVLEMGLEYTEVEGEAAFYGPKLDFMVRDALGREWQLGTVQQDYNLPERFDLWYTGEDNQKHRPVMIHRAPFGSLERFMGVLIEHCGGHFKTWLAPVQVAIIPVSDLFLDYAKEVATELRASGYRVEVDDRREKVGYKIRGAETQKIPYMLVVGQQEVETSTVAVREHRKGAQETSSLDDFKKRIATEIEAAIG